MSDNATPYVSNGNNEADMSRALQGSVDTAKLVTRALAVQLARTPGVSILPLDTLGAAYVRAVVEAFRGNKSHAARALGIDRRSVYRWLAKAA